MGSMDQEGGQEATDGIQGGKQYGGGEPNCQPGCRLGCEVSGSGGCQRGTDDGAGLVVGDCRPAIGVDPEGGQLERGTHGHPEIQISNDEPFAASTVFRHLT